MEFLNFKDKKFEKDLIDSASNKVKKDLISSLADDEINFIKHIDKETTFTHEIKHYHDMLFSVYGIWKSTYNFEKLLNFYELMYFNKEYNNGTLKLDFSMLHINLDTIDSNKFPNIHKLLEKGHLLSLMDKSELFSTTEIMEALSVCVQLQEIYKVYGENSSDAYLKLKLSKNNEYSKVLICFNQLFKSLHLENIFYILMCSLNGDIQKEFHNAFPCNRLEDIITFIFFERGIQSLHTINIREVMKDYYISRKFIPPLLSIKNNINMHMESIERIKDTHNNEKKELNYELPHQNHLRDVLKIMDEITIFRKDLFKKIEQNEDLLFSLNIYVNNFALLPEPHIFYYSKIKQNNQVATSVATDKNFYNDFDILQYVDEYPLLISRKKPFSHSNNRLSDTWLKFIDEIFLLYTFIEGVDINSSPDIFKIFNMRINSSYKV